MREEGERKGKPEVEEFRGERSRKTLRCATEVTAYQKEYFRSYRKQVAEGEPVVWKYVVTPEEIFKTMDLLDYDMQHYSALCSAKQMSRYYLDVLNSRGYFRDLCRYCTVPLGYAFEQNSEIAPWGGLPKFALPRGREYRVLPDLSDPMRALAARVARAMGVFRTPCTNVDKWHVHIAKRYKADGVILMVVESCKLLYASVLFAREALEKAGIPTLEVNADMVDARDWDDAKMKALVTSFIETLMP